MFKVITNPTPRKCFVRCKYASVVGKAIITYLRKISQEKGEDNLLKRIKSICESKGMSLRQLEQEAGLALNTISRWEKNKPSIDKVKKVADTLGVTMDELLREEEADDNPEN